MVHAGVDIAKANHVTGAADDAGEQVGRPMPSKNGDAGSERCIAWPESVAEGPEDVSVGMGATGRYRRACFARLASAGHRVCVANPMRVHAMRGFGGLAGIKDDGIDGILMASALRRGNFEQTQLATDDVQSPRRLARCHQGPRQGLATVETQAACVLDSYSPEHAGPFPDMFGSAPPRLLAECPIPSEVARRRTPTIAGPLREGPGGRLGEARAAEAEAAAKGPVGIGLGEDAAAFQMRCVVSQMGSLESTIEEVGAQVAELLAGVEPSMATTPGAGTVAGAQIVAETGDARRLGSAASIVKHAGLDSGVDESGEFAAAGVPVAKHGSPHLRRAMRLAASRAWQCDRKLGELYRKRRAGSKPHRVAVTAVARRLCHIVHAVMRDGKPYDPDRWRGILRAIHPEAFGIRLSRFLDGSGSHAGSPGRKIRVERSAWS